jgi:hypothetical protein
MCFNLSSNEIIFEIKFQVPCVQAVNEYTVLYDAESLPRKLKHKVHTSKNL